MVQRARSPAVGWAGGDRAAHPGDAPLGAGRHPAFDGARRRGAAGRRRAAAAAPDVGDERDRRPFASFEGDDYLVGFPLEAVQLENDGTPHLPLDFGLLLLHEFAYILDYHGGWSASAAWKRAVAASPCVVSDYAETSPQEDFAESVAAWLAYYQARVPHHVEEPEDWRYRRYMTQQRLERMALRMDYRERLGERFAVPRRLMHSPP